MISQWPASAGTDAIAVATRRAPDSMQGDSLRQVLCSAEYEKCDASPQSSTNGRIRPQAQGGTPSPELTNETGRELLPARRIAAVWAPSGPASSPQNFKNRPAFRFQLLISVLKIFTDVV